LQGILTSGIYFCELELRFPIQPETENNHFSAKNNENFSANEKNKSKIVKNALNKYHFPVLTLPEGTDLSW